MGIIEAAVAIGTSFGAAASAGAGAVAGAVGAAGSAIAGATLGEIGMAMGLAGAGLGVIGQAAGIKELSYAGMALGALGGITAIGSSIANIGTMTLEQAMTNVSDFMAGKIGTTAGSLAEATQAGSGVLNTATQNAVSEGAGEWAHAGTQALTEAGPPPTIGGPPPTELTGLNPNVVPSANAAAKMAPVAEAATPLAPAAPSVSAPLAPGQGVLSAAEPLPIQNDIASSIANAGKAGSVPGMPVSAAGAAPSLWSKAKDLVNIPFSNMSTDQKTILALVAAQGGSGLLGGMFQGMSAEQRLEFDKLVNQQQYGQMQYLNKNNQYAPKISFGNTANPSVSLTPAGGALNATRA